MPPERNDKLSLTHRFFRASAAPKSCVRNSLDSTSYIAHTARPPKPRTDERRTNYASQKRCVAKHENMRSGFFRLNNLNRTHRAAPKHVAPTTNYEP